ncbi:MAG: hypothetical protein IT376_05925 [Polyangiaceae bacterium]|nr:hypothetical protein [Polyangiaceae bacterium]
MRSPLQVALALALGVGCSSEAAPTPAERAPAFRHQALFDRVASSADGFTVVEGDWLEDYGDAPFYGLAASSRLVAGGRAEPWGGRAAAARARARTLIDSADFVNGDVNELAMSALGLIEHAAATGDLGDVEALEVFLKKLQTLAAALGHYLASVPVESWAFRTYGPTSITALVGLVALQHAHLVGGEHREEHVEFAKALEAATVREAWTGAHFAFAPGEPRLDLYPNVAMTLLESRLYQLTGDPAYRDRASQLHAAIQPLRLAESPAHYYTEYSAVEMGAKTRDYSTLSAHNYLMFSLLLLFESTGEPRFLEEADSVLDWVDRDLSGEWCLSHVHDEPCAPACTSAPVCVAGACAEERCGPGVLHHRIDGRVALPSDPEFFCSGCNLQLLYVLWYRQQL